MIINISNIVYLICFLNIKSFTAFIYIIFFMNALRLSLISIRILRICFEALQGRLELKIVLLV